MFPGVGPKTYMESKMMGTGPDHHWYDTIHARQQGSMFSLHLMIFMNNSHTWHYCIHKLGFRIPNHLRTSKTMSPSPKKPGMHFTLPRRLTIAEKMQSRSKKKWSWARQSIISEIQHLTINLAMKSRC